MPAANKIAEKIKEYCKELYGHGWIKLTVNYSGSGDSCDSFICEIANKEETISLDEVKTAFTGFTVKDVEQALLDMLPVGFENNEGGAGTITVNIKTGKITLAHDEYYTETRHTKTVY